MGVAECTKQVCRLQTTYTKRLDCEAKVTSLCESKPSMTMRSWEKWEKYDST